LKGADARVTVLSGDDDETLPLDLQDIVSQEERTAEMRVYISNNDSNRSEYKTE
jgi:hypothetical protein